MKEVSLKAQWIWSKNNTIKDDKVIFRKTFELNQLVDYAPAYIAVDTKYWLHINGELVVFEGGLFRESIPGCGYADEIDLAQHLKIGTNVLVILCWYFGNEGRNNTDSKEAGLIFECQALDIYSDASFMCLRHPAYYKTGEPLPSYLYGGYNIAYDGRKETGDYHSNDYCDMDFVNATTYTNNNWGKLFLRPIPLHLVGPVVMHENNNEKNREYHYKLPYAMAFCPCLELYADGGEIISICSDRYEVNGGPGDEFNLYNGQRIEYICREGYNRFESIQYIFGEEIQITSDVPILVTTIGYRETGYDCEINGQFECDCEITNQLIKKAARTLYVCMRDNFMDCPDRERGQWIGDVSVQVPQTFFLLSDNAIALVKKSISDFIRLRKGDILVGNVPGANFSELPAQSLNAISEIGLISEYYKYTGDKTTLELAFEPCIHYLKLWHIAENGLVAERHGNWRWFDHLYNVDEPVLENAWYYSALKFARTMADIVNDHRFDTWLEERMGVIQVNFEKVFWKGSYYASGEIVDDRGNAMAMLSGLCPRDRYPFIRKILISVFNSSVYMENYVLMALCEMGYVKDAYKRMVSRYYNLATNENSTLWEDFYILGTKNHAWSGAPVTIAFKYFMGIDTQDGFKTFTVNPEKSLFNKMSCRFQALGGYVHIKVENETVNVIIENSSESELIS